MLLNDVGQLLIAVQFQLSLYDGCRPVNIKAWYLRADTVLYHRPFLHEMYGIFVIRMLSSIWLNIGTDKLQNNEHVDDFLAVI